MILGFEFQIAQALMQTKIKQKILLEKCLSALYPYPQTRSRFHRTKFKGRK